MNDIRYKQLSLKLTKTVLLLFLSFVPFQPAFSLPPLQLYIEITPSGGVLNLEPGFYSGPAVITRPITINGHGMVTIDAQGEGTVLSVEADNTIISGLHLTSSGHSFDKMDAGIIIKADNVLIENNIIENTLFGIILHRANKNTIRNNSITSIETSLSLRGDGLRMWNSFNNII